MDERKTTSPNQTLIEWGVATRALSKHAESGDQYLVEPFPNGVLVAVIDGLGHGDQAAAVAKTAVSTLKEDPAEPVTVLLHHCHRRLRHSRGVVMSLASFNSLDHTLTWVGVGNVEGILLRIDAQRPLPHGEPVSESLVLRGGVVGYNLPTLRQSTLRLNPGDILIFVTDGIRSGFVRGLTQHNNSMGQLFNRWMPATQMADHILTHYGRDTDDAMVLVARYLGGQGAASPG